MAHISCATGSASAWNGVRFIEERHWQSQWHTKIQPRPDASAFRLMLQIIGTRAVDGDFRPGGALDCSHGCSGAATTSPDAEPVETVHNKTTCPGGATEVCHVDSDSGAASGPPGRNWLLSIRSTGSAALHPWLQSNAPPGRRRNHGSLDEDARITTIAVLPPQCASVGSHCGDVSGGVPLETSDGRHRMRLGLQCSALWIGLVSAPVAGFAADDDRVFDDQPEKAKAVAIVQQQVVMLGSSGQTNADRLRPQLDHVLMTEIGKIDAECMLTTEQVRKLQLAGRGDIHRILNEMFQIERESIGRTQRGDADVNMQKEVRRRVLAPAQNPFAGPSLFRKVLHKMLTPEQHRALLVLEETEQSQQRRAHVAAIYRAKAPLRDDQEGPLAEFLQSRYPHWRPGSGSSLSVSVVMMMIVEQGNDVRPLLTEAQWQFTAALANTAPQRELLLRDYGLWPIPAAEAPTMAR